MYVRKALAIVFFFDTASLYHPPIEGDTMRSYIIYKGNVSSV
jgi:hypothetical protein